MAAEQVIAAALEELEPVLGVQPACELLGRSRAGRRPRAFDRLAAGRRFVLDVRLAGMFVQTSMITGTITGLRWVTSKK